jgi:glycosyltransferase
MLPLYPKAMKVTYLTASLNPGPAIADCLASVAAQVVPADIEVEHFVLDGGSSDGTVGRLAEWAGSCAGRRYRSENDAGFYDALNAGIALTGGDIVGILNADDFYFDRQVLSRVAGVFEDPAVSGAYGDLVYVGSGDARNRYQIKRYWKAGPFRSSAFRHGWMPPHPTIFVRREVYEESGSFKTNFGTAADYEWMLRAIYKANRRLVYIPRVLVAMRAGGMSNQSIRARLLANCNDQQAWTENRIRPLPWMFLMKPLRKIPQWWRRPLKGACGDSTTFLK